MTFLSDLDTGTGTTPQYKGSGAALFTLNTAKVNPVDNANFNIWQRGTSFTPVTTGTPLADRWKMSWAGTSAVVTISQSTTVPTITQSGVVSLYSMKMVVGTADASIAAGDFVGFAQYIEGYSAQLFAQRQFTISFWVRAHRTGTYCVGILNLGGTDSYTAEYTVSVADTWEYKTITVPAISTGTWFYDSRAAVGLVWCIAGGSTFQGTAGAWQSGTYVYCTSNQVNGVGATSDVFHLSQVRITPGAIAEVLNPLHYADDLLRCQRYYISYTSETLGLALNTTTLYSSGHLCFPVEMRAAPTLASGATYTASTGSNGTANAPLITTKGVAFNNAGGANWTANARIDFTGAFTADI
jgi:hypothetical protein